MGSFTLNSKTPSRLLVITSAGFPRETAGLVVSLAASSMIGLAVAGSRPGLAGAFLDLLTVSSLILAPICLKRSGYRLAMIIAAATMLSSIMTLSLPSISALNPAGIGTAVWASVQVAVMKFAYNAYTKSSAYLG